MVTVVLKDKNSNNPLTMEEEYAKQYFHRIVERKLDGITPGDLLNIVIVNSIINSFDNKSSLSTTVELLAGGKFAPIDIGISPDIQIQERDQLTDLFLKIKAKFNTDRVMLFTYGHGSAFGIFETDLQKFLSFASLPENFSVPLFNSSAFPQNIYGLKYEKMPDNLNSFEYRQGFVEIEYATNNLKSYEINNSIAQTVLPPGLLQDVVPLPNGLKFTPFKVISNEDISSALQTAFSKVDFVVLCNCIMQNVYSQYCFKGITNYLVAPETAITSPGFNIRRIIEFLNDKPGEDNTVLSKEIISSFDNNNPEYFQYQSFIDLFVVVSLNLDNYDPILEQIRQMKSFLFEKMDTLKSLRADIHNALGNCFPYEFNTNTGHTFIDILQFLSTDNIIKYENLAVIKDQLDILLNNNIHIFKGKKVFSQQGASYAKQNIGGLSIYFPRNNKVKNHEI